jgi:AmmeMemoRadiSam system protein B
MGKVLKIREPAVAGLFYPADKVKLEKEIALFLEKSPIYDGCERIYGLAAPHAGYIYSGGVAAQAYRQLMGKSFDVVVVISPSHTVYFNKISVYNGDAYRTPLGDISIDQELAWEICERNPKIELSGLGHDGEEHALEVQLPFLQYVLNGFKLLPIVMGDQSLLNIDILSDALVHTLKDRNALIIASSDLSHFHDYETAVELDQRVVGAINIFNEDKLYDELRNDKCEMCGGGPVIATMKACKKLGANKSKVLTYRNSGDVTGDRSRVVGYLSALFYK